MSTADRLLHDLRALLAEFRSPEHRDWLTSACADRLEAVLTKHAPPEVGSCANQLAGWLRTQPSVDSRSGAEVAKAILADYPDELDKAACDSCEQCGQVVMCSFHSVLSMLLGRTPPTTHLNRMDEWRDLVREVKA
jgi:hypothetical protein